MSDHFSLALGIGTQNSAGDWLEVFYPQPILHPDRELVAIFATHLAYQGGNQAIKTMTALCEAKGSIVQETGVVVWSSSQGKAIEDIARKIGNAFQ